MTRFDRGEHLACVLFVAAAGCARSANDREETDHVVIDPRSITGELGTLIPFHKDAIHSSIILDKDGQPWLCFWMRPSEYRGSDLVDPATNTLRDLFQQLVYGGFGFSGTLDASVRSRIAADIPRDNALCVDLDDPLALWESGKTSAADLTPEDFAVNAHAFKNAGHSLGLNYNLFCSGHVMLADGRIAVFGGHDKSGNYGTDAVNIFSARKWQWEPRAVPAVKPAYLADPTNSDPASHPSALDEQFTDPQDPSDMRYQRWYPSAVPLPDGRVLVLSGTDQDSSISQDDASATKVRQGVPEIYDPQTDSTFALESAYRLLAMYPRSYVVQTGNGSNAWKVAVMGSVAFIPADLDDYDPFSYTGDTYFLDVPAAIADPDREVRASNHWSFVATATTTHESGAGAALWELDGDGEATKQRVVAFGGDSGAGSDEVATVEMIDYSAPIPQWAVMQPLAQPVTQNVAVAMADGNVLVFGGRGGTPRTNNLQLQIFNPDAGTTLTVETTMIPRHDHATGLLLPDATVLLMGGNRVQIVPGNPDAGVPVGEIYRPPYLFRGPRPEIDRGPRGIGYGERFVVWLAGDTDIAKVTLSRIGPVTHNWDWGNRHVSLGFTQTGNKLEIAAPKFPGLAVPGVYMLFVIDDDGVPSHARFVRLGV
jgi:hypothetical protein